MVFIDRITAVMISGIILLMGFTVQQRAHQSSVEGTMLYDLRRGRATCHVQFDEPTAILVGDALQARAFEVLADRIRPAGIAAKCCAELARAAGAEKLVGGQSADLDGVFAGASEASCGGVGSPRGTESCRGVCGNVRCFGPIGVAVLRYVRRPVSVRRSRVTVEYPA